MVDHTIDVGHVITSPPDRSYYACPACRLSWPTWTEARQHMTDEHDWPAFFTCDVAGCEQTFATMAEVIVHESGHFGGPTGGGER